MYVLMDLEWVTNKGGLFSPTQIGAMRVDNAWEKQSAFYSRIRPRDPSFYDWKHMGYIGGTAADFLHAPGIHQILTNLKEWLREDDVICIWATDAKNILKSSYNLVLKETVPQRIIVISDYVYPYLEEHGFKRGNPHRITSVCGIATPKPKHHSGNDVITIQQALKAIGYPAERFNRRPETFDSDTAREDFYTLTQPRFAFWAGKGYGTFHLRNCRKLRGLSNLKGFSRYHDAERAGHTPCKYCKPTRRNDIAFSFPITSQKRAHETVADLIARCEAHGYPYEETLSPFIFRTPVGCWKINTEQIPYILYHINLTHTPDNKRFFHRQPRLFLSLADTFDYIYRHDTALEKKIREEKEKSGCQTASGS